MLRSEPILPKELDARLKAIQKFVNFLLNFPPHLERIQLAGLSDVKNIVETNIKQMNSWDLAYFLHAVNKRQSQKTDQIDESLLNSMTK